MKGGGRETSLPSLLFQMLLRPVVMEGFSRPTALLAFEDLKLHITTSVSWNNSY
jgi:hypothetical protein